MKKSFFSILLILGFALSAIPLTAAEKTVVYFFWGEGCPHCTAEKPFLESMEAKYPNLEVRSFETWSNKGNAEIFQAVATAYNTRAGGVPTTFIGDYEPIVGYADSMAESIEAKIVSCLENGCVDPGVKAGIVQNSDVNAEENKITEDPVAIPAEETTEWTEEIDSREITELTESDEVLSELSNTETIAVQEQTQNVENAGAKSESDVCIHLFYRDGCPQCQVSDDFINTLEGQYNINLIKHNVSESKGSEMYEIFKEKYGLVTAAFPIIFLDDKYLIGEKAINNYLEKEIISCQKDICICPIENIKGSTPFLPQAKDITPEKREKLDLPFIGEINISAMPLFLTTAIIAFVDGFNPCSLWLITFLLGIVIYSGSRKKIILVAVTFLLVTTAAYGLFMVGLLNVFLYVGYLKWIQVTVALLALTFALVNIKDYFWYKKGISFTISDKHRPKIFKDIRNIMKGGKSNWAIVSATATMALGVMLVELPCTAGFPVIWTNIIAQHQTEGLAFAMLLALYLLIYMLDELIVVGIAAFTLKASRFEEKHGRILKLIGGVIMLSLALVILIKPELMNDIAGSLVIFAAATITSFLILFIHRKLLPKFGIKIGSEEDLVALEDKQSENDNLDNNNNNQE